LIPALTYMPRRNPLCRAGALAATAYLGAFVAVAFGFSNPIVLAADGLAVVVVALAAGVGRSLALAARFAAYLGVLMVVTNAVASQRGDTILVRGPDLPLLGTVNISAEAMAEGAILALRIAVVIAAFAVYTAAVDPDRVLRLLRPLARRSALTASLIVRLVPLAAADHARISEAAALRGPGAAGVGRAAVLRRLVSGSLDRSVDVAATLELRGFARGAPGRARRLPRSPADAAFWSVAALIVGFSALALLAGAADYESYPVVALERGPGVLLLGLALPLLAWAPFGARR